MPALHAPMALPTLADRDTKFVHHGPLHGQVFRDCETTRAAAPPAAAGHAPAAARHASHRRAAAGVDAPPAIRGPALRPGRSGCAFGRPRENGAA